MAIVINRDMLARLKAGQTITCFADRELVKLDGTTYYGYVELVLEAPDEADQAGPDAAAGVPQLPDDDDRGFGR